MPVVREPNRFDRVAYLVRGDGLTSAIAAAAILGFVAGILDASNVKWPLWVYTVIAPLLAIVVLVLRRRRTRLVIAQWLFRRGADRADELATPPRPATRNADRRHRSWVDVTSTPDAYYRGGFATMHRRDASPLIITASNPRDVSRPDQLTQPLFSAQWDGRPLTVDLGPLVPNFELIRSLPQANDPNHTFASRDVCYLPELGAELMLMAESASPLARPEHCVDTKLLADHDLVIVSGPDTNFWHAALYEGVARRFGSPVSSIRLGAGLRDVSSAGVPVYGSSDLFVRVRHASEAFSRRPDDNGEVRLPEATHPTYGFLLLTTNPLSDPHAPRWCVFVAGLRSIGTMAATLVLTSMLRAMRTEQIDDVWSAVPISDGFGDVAARCSFAVVRASVVEAAATPSEPRVRRPIAHDRPDPLYRDSYVVVEAEVLDNTGPDPRWRTVSIDAFAPEAGAWASSRAD